MENDRSHRTSNTKALYVEVPIEMHGQLAQVANRNDRKIKAEVIAAIKRYLENPEVVSVPPPPPPTTPKKRGRPRKT